MFCCLESGIFTVNELKPYLQAVPILTPEGNSQVTDFNHLRKAPNRICKAVFFSFHNERSSAMK